MERALEQAVKFKRDKETEKAFGWVQVRLVYHLCCLPLCLVVQSLPSCTSIP